MMFKTKKNRCATRSTLQDYESHYQATRALYIFSVWVLNTLNRTEPGVYYTLGGFGHLL